MKYQKASQGHQQHAKPKPVTQEQYAYAVAFEVAVFEYPAFYFHAVAQLFSGYDLFDS